MKEIYAKKSLGQNFLKDESVLQKIANVFEPKKEDLIIEIGPGMGDLTKYLVKKDALVIAYEIDERMTNYLKEYDNLKVILGDFLKTDFSELKEYKYQKLYVIANIPYYITTPIIEHLLNSKVIPDNMLLLVQKEVAQRFSAKAGTTDYGYFTLVLNHYFKIEKLFDVDPKCFVPAPKVTSSVVKFTKKENIINLNEKDFFNFVKKAFLFKRKTLKNNLKEYNKDKLEEFLKFKHYSNDLRAEALTYEDFVELYDFLKNN